jgi:[ribosomal protein S5]-alanine N-acetyltransferase
MENKTRLLFSNPVIEDFQRFFEIHSDPDTNLFNPTGPMHFESATTAFTTILNHWKKYSFGAWSVREKEKPDHIIGFGGLDYRLYGNDMKLNLGYRFDKIYWGKGYATELATYAITFGFLEIDKDEIFALVRPNHVASIHVIKKCKMQLVDELNDVKGEPASLIYKIQK